MCLSTLYKNKLEKESILMKNVTTIKTIDGKIIFKDLMERTLELKGFIKEINLEENYIIVGEVE